MSYSSALLLPLLCGSVSQYRRCTGGGTLYRRCPYSQQPEGNDLTAYSLQPEGNDLTAYSQWTHLYSCLNMLCVLLSAACGNLRRWVHVDTGICRH